MYRGFFEYDGTRVSTSGMRPGLPTARWAVSRHPRSEYLSERTNTVWAAVHNQFFATLVMPTDRRARLFARHVDCR
jgi:hypothetical protein